MDYSVLTKNLQKNNMQVFVLKNRSEVLDKIKTLVQQKDKVCFGGSVTLDECGVTDFFNKNYTVLQRIEANSADVLFSGANAITMDGEIYNVDGIGNRVAANIYGPKSVIVVAGRNKIVKDLKEANIRVKTIAAPKNCVRLKKDTFCAKKGYCKSIEDKNTGFTAGCDSNDRICCAYTILGLQRIKDRIKIILVDENLGL